MRLSMLMRLVVATLVLTLSAHAQGPAPAGGVEEIHLNGDCELIYQQPGKSKLHTFKSWDICRRGNVNSSRWANESLNNGVPSTVFTDVNEVSYELHNVTDHTVVFFLHQRLPKGWEVDSVPQPEISNGVATFQAYAQPGQLVKLHTGQRHASPPQKH